jgi:hypothetical protein
MRQELKRRTSELNMHKVERKDIKPLPVHLEDQMEFPLNYLQTQHELSLPQYPVPGHLRILSMQDKQQNNLWGGGERNCKNLIISQMSCYMIHKKLKLERI